MLKTFIFLEVQEFDFEIRALFVTMGCDTVHHFSMTSTKNELYKRYNMYTIINILVLDIIIEIIHVAREHNIIYAGHPCVHSTHACTYCMRISTSSSW